MAPTAEKYAYKTHDGTTPLPISAGIAKIVVPKNTAFFVQQKSGMVEAIPLFSSLRIPLREYFLSRFRRLSVLPLSRLLQL